MYTTLSFAEIMRDMKELKQKENLKKVSQPYVSFIRNKRQKRKK